MDWKEDILSLKKPMSHLQSLSLATSSSPLPNLFFSAQLWPLNQLPFHSHAPALLVHFPAAFAIFPDVQLNIKWIDRQNMYSPNHLFPINIHVQLLLTRKSYAHTWKGGWPLKWSLHLKVRLISPASTLTRNQSFPCHTSLFLQE